jgi:hypothetical protein
MKICILNFQPDYEPMIASGDKPHTIRVRHPLGLDPLPGDMLALYVGRRTKAARLIRSEACEYAHDIMIQQSAGNVHHILLGGRPMDQPTIEQLAQQDGFGSAAELVRYFETNYGLPFTGLLIGWIPTPICATRH